MRHDDERFLALPGQTEEQIHDRVAGFGIEIAGRFVGKNDVRIIRQGAGDRDPLLFAAGKFRREMIQAVAEADRRETFGASFPRCVTPIIPGSMTFSSAVNSGRRK